MSTEKGNSVSKSILCQELASLEVLQTIIYKKFIMQVPSLGIQKHTQNHNTPLTHTYNPSHAQGLEATVAHGL